MLVLHLVLAFYAVLDVLNCFAIVMLICREREREKEREREIYIYIAECFNLVVFLLSYDC